MSLALFLHASCWIALYASVFSLKKKPLISKCLFVSFLYVIAFIPIQGMPLIAFPLGVLSDLSLTTTTLAVLSLVRLFRAEWSFSLANYRLVWISLVVFAVVFYPSSLGLVYFDIYSYGYQPDMVLVMLCLAALAFWRFRLYLPVATILVALCGYNLRLLTSDNLWDYLLDPVLVGYAVLQLSIYGFRMRSAPDGKAGKA